MIYVAGGGMRTGSVAMFQIMRGIVSSTLTGYAPELPIGKEDEYFKEHAKSWADDPLKIVVKLHLWHPALEQARDCVSAVVPIRDIRDVVVSLIHFRETDFEKALHAGAVMGNVNSQLEWMEKIPDENRLLFISYEDFISHRMETTVQVAKFMGISLSDPEAARIERKWNLRANQKRALDKHRPGHPDYMSERHIYSGRAGRWKHELSNDQVLQVQDRAGEDYFVRNNYLMVNRETPTVLILAAGEADRWKAPVPKQLADIGRRPLIARTIEQARDMFGTEPEILTTDLDIAKQGKFFAPDQHKFLVDTLLFSQELWENKVIVLLGDVYYSDELLVKVNNCNNQTLFFGRLLEIYALVFNDYDLIRQVIRNIADLGEGKLWNIWYELNGYPHNEHTYPHHANPYFRRVDDDDITMDIDTWEDYLKLAEKIGVEVK
jgi:hypothetical protein